jgi:hypothetical protein
MRLSITFAALLLLLPGCAGGPEATRAHELLVQADVAQAQLSSVAYGAKTSFSVAGQSFAFDLDGEAALKGAAAGDQWVRMTSGNVPGVGRIEMSIARRGDRMTITSMGQTQDVPVPAELATTNEAWGSLASGQLATCVKKVDVEEGRNLNGEPASRIAGLIDTKCALESISRVSSLGQSQSAPQLDLDDIDGVEYGDARATLFVSERSHLLIGGVLSMSMELQGQKMSFEVSYRLKSVNRPVRFP